MQVQVHFTFANEDEFTNFSNKFAAVQAKPPVSEKAVAPAKEEKKEPSLNQKIAAKAQKEAAPETETEEATGEVDFEAVGDAILNLSKKKGRDAAVAVLAKFGYKKVDANMKAEDYPKVVAACKAALAE